LGKEVVKRRTEEVGNERDHILEWLLRRRKLHSERMD
jgi:hypothetical protein